MFLNMLPLLNFLRAIQDAATKPHVVYFSSGGAVYGRNPGRIPWRETDQCQPTSSYGIQKLAAEHYLRLAAEKGQLTCTVLRVSNAYGTLLPPERMQGLVGVAINNALHNAPVRVFGDMGNVRDYVHLLDICAIAEKAAQPTEPFTILNVGSGRGYSVTEVLDTIQDCIGSPLRIDKVEDPHCGRWLSDWAVLDITKARAAFEWIPTVDFRAGIRSMIVDWHAEARAHPGGPASHQSIAH
jgi:UDP-glucose 4-epimerase